jgi:ribonuclease HII
LAPIERIAGVDEVGRGPLAGPVVVAAVILDSSRPIAGLADSKKLSAARRETLATQIHQGALAVSIVEIDAAEIDRLNILQATLAGMVRAVAKLKRKPTAARIDGNQVPAELRAIATAIVGGDAIDPAISAASIVAKVHRDALMVAFDAQFPGYGFAIHKGYPTPAHLTALKTLGPCAIHRRSFAPVRAASSLRSSQ